MPYLVFLRKQ